MKATALSKGGRNDEALQEYFMCLALKPDWTKVKLEAQKVRGDSPKHHNNAPHIVALIHVKEKMMTTVSSSMCVGCEH